MAQLAESLRRLASAGLTHPSIVSPIDAGLESTTAYLAMDYVAAETLDVALRHLAPMSLDRALPLLTQAADAITTAWQAGFGHGALHPRDMFVTLDTTELRISGFGVVPALERVGIKPPVRRPYTAPERLRGDDWDERADVYALGSIAHELLTRRRPAGPGEQDGALTPGTTAEQRVLIRRVLAAALAEQPEHRFASATALVEALAAIVRGETAIALPDVEGPEPAPDALVEKPLPPLFAHIDEPIAAPELLFEPEPVAALPTPAADVSPPNRAPEPTTVATPSTPVETASDLHEPPLVVPDEARMWPAEPEAPRPAAEWHPSPIFGAAPEPRASFPWGAVAAVAVAATLLGLVVGYQYGRHSVTPAVAPASVESTSLRPADTEVPVQPDTDTSRAKPVPVRPDAAAAPEKRASSPPASLAKSSPPASSRSSAGTGRRAASRPPARAALGSIFVDSRPRAARVIIDGRFVGVTPLRVPELANGAHSVRLELTGHQPFVTRTTVKPGEQTRVTASLEEKR